MISESLLSFQNNRCSPSFNPIPEGVKCDCLVFLDLVSTEESELKELLQCSLKHLTFWNFAPTGLC